MSIYIKRRQISYSCSFLLSIVYLEYCKDSSKNTSSFKELDSSRLETYPNTNSYKKEEEEYFTIATMGGRYYSLFCRWRLWGSEGLSDFSRSQDPPMIKPKYKYWCMLCPCHNEVSKCNKWKSLRVRCVQKNEFLSTTAML